MNDKPLMWTARGNYPVDELRYEHEWTQELRDNGDTIVWLKEAWFFADGELAKNNAHGYVLAQKSNDVTVGLQGAGIGGEQAVMQ